MLPEARALAAQLATVVAEEAGAEPPVRVQEALAAMVLEVLPRPAEAEAEAAGEAMPQRPLAAMAAPEALHKAEAEAEEPALLARELAPELEVWGRLETLQVTAEAEAEAVEVQTAPRLAEQALELLPNLLLVKLV